MEKAENDKKENNDISWIDDIIKEHKKRKKYIIY
jgi:hypothetical protein